MKRGSSVKISQLYKDVDFMFKESIPHSAENNFYRGFKVGIEQTLKELGIKIEGVNK